VSQGNNGLSRGDRNRNARLAALRAVLPLDHAILGVDLAKTRQAAVLTDHDSRVLARWRPRCSVWQLDDLLARALRAAKAAGFTGITVACEPTGHRWMVLGQLAGRRAMPLVCVQPLVVARAREAEDYTCGKNDDKDAVLIARLAAQLHCYLPEQADTRWARLRHLGARRAQLIDGSTACTLRLRDLLEVAWPVVLCTAGEPMSSATWLASLDATLAAGDGDLAAVHAGGQEAFLSAVRARVGVWGAKRACLRIARAVYAALVDATGVSAQRLGALERARAALHDLHAVRGQLQAVNAVMLGLLDELGVLAVAGSTPGVSAICVAAILAETGDPARFASARAMVKHAGLAPAEHASGNSVGPAKVSRRGRPALRLAAWRAVWGALRHNRIYAARHAGLMRRDGHKLHRFQADAAIAASIIRQIHAIVTRGVAWDAEIATGRRRPGREVSAKAA
jgi:transposase